jgi:hypothetical protein
MKKQTKKNSLLYNKLGVDDDADDTGSKMSCFPFISMVMVHLTFSFNV